MPVIRRDPAAGVPGSSAQVGRSSAASAGRPTSSESVSQSGSTQPTVSGPTDAITLLDKAVEEFKRALADQHLRTQYRVVRGLEALDHRDVERHRATKESFEAGIHEVAVKLDELKYELHWSARRQFEEMSQRLDFALDGVVEVLRHMKAEIAAIHYSLDASRSEALMESSRTAGEETS